MLTSLKCNNFLVKIMFNSEKYVGHNNKMQQIYKRKKHTKKGMYSNYLPKYKSFLVLGNSQLCEHSQGKMDERVETENSKQKIPNKSKDE